MENTNERCNELFLKMDETEYESFYKRAKYLLRGIQGNSYFRVQDNEV
jgi:hypothetical protein